MESMSELLDELERVRDRQEKIIAAIGWPRSTRLARAVIAKHMR